MNQYPIQQGYPPQNYYPPPQGMYPQGYYPPPPQPGPPPGYNLGRAIMPNQAGSKASRIMSTLFNVGRELKAVERSADYQRGGITFNHMDKNRAYMNSTDDIEIAAVQMDRKLKGEGEPEPSNPVDIDDIQSQFMYNTPPFEQQYSNIQPTPPANMQVVQAPYNQQQIAYQQSQIQTQNIENNIMPVDINQYIKPQQPAAPTPAPVQSPMVAPTVNLANLEKGLLEMNNKLEAIAQMIGMLVQGQKNSVAAIQQAMTTSLGDSVASAVASAFNSYMEMQQQPEPDFDASFVPGEEVESEQA